jgi:hypothetical protein
LHELGFGAANFGIEGGCGPLGSTERQGFASSVRALDPFHPVDARALKCRSKKAFGQHGNPLGVAGEVCPLFSKVANRIRSSRTRCQLNQLGIEMRLQASAKQKVSRLFKVRQRDARIRDWSISCSIGAIRNLFRAENDVTLPALPGVRYV